MSPLEWLWFDTGTNKGFRTRVVPRQRLVSPEFTKTGLNGYEGVESIVDGSREVVRVALLGPEGPTGTFTRWDNVTIPW